MFYSIVIDRNPAAPAPDPRLPPQSCLLLPPTPVRGGQKAVVSRKTNMHIFIESGLQVRISPKVRLTAPSGSGLYCAAESSIAYFFCKCLTTSKLWNVFFKGALVRLLFIFISFSTYFTNIILSELMILT